VDAQGQSNWLCDLLYDKAPKDGSCLKFPTVSSSVTAGSVAVARTSQFPQIMKAADVRPPAPMPWRAPPCRRLLRAQPWRHGGYREKGRVDLLVRVGRRHRGCGR